MMQSLAFRWRGVSIVKDLLLQSTGSAATTATLSPSCMNSVNFVLIHSTAASSDRWKTKGKSAEGSGQRPSKNYIRFETRQKRADTKRALKGLLFNNGSQGSFTKLDDRNSWNEVNADHLDSRNKRSHANSSTRRARKTQHNRWRRKLRRQSYSDDEPHPETVFHATFGSKAYTWAFKSMKDSDFQDSSTNGFEWREHVNWSSDERKWQNPSDIESDDEPCFLSSSSDRILLGLPSEGPLNIEVVKNAFRASALKWHPDKHQGPSQEIAAEKFKLCVNAYKSLCTALSS